MKTQTKQQTKRFFGLALCLLFLSGCGDITSSGGDESNTPVPSSGRTLYFYYGPLKLMFGETILDSIEAITGYEFGNWDFTAPEPATNDNDPAFFIFADAGNGPVNPESGEDTYYTHCRLLGGCMEHSIPQGRTSFVGTAFVLELEKAVAEACYDQDNQGASGMFPGGLPLGASVQAIDIINHQYLVAFGVEPSVSERELSIAYFDEHLADGELRVPLTGPIIASNLETAGRGHCRALLVTNRFIFY